LAEDVNGALNELTEREAKILTLRFELSGAKETLSEGVRRDFQGHPGTNSIDPEGGAV